MTTDPYEALAGIYEAAGFSEYATTITPHVITHLQQTGWIGRRILDLGCGTGASCASLVNLGMDVFALDRSPAMMKLTKMRFMGTDYRVEYIEEDMRGATFPTDMDLVFAIGNVLNELDSLRELELVFRKAYDALQPGRRFVFDMMTLRGLGDYLGGQEQVLDISNQLFMVVHNTFAYDTMTLRQIITFFTQQKDSRYTRHAAYLYLKSYPFLRIMKVLTSVGFEVKGAYDLNLNTFDPNNDREGRFIAVAEKPSD